MKSSRHELLDIARQAMIDRGFLPDFSDDVTRELRDIEGDGSSNDGLRDLTGLPWCSIDNDDTRDIDQLTVATREGEDIRIRVGIADVDARVRRGSAIDRHAEHNTTTVYTPAMNFLMLPEELSTDLTSLVEGESRAAIVMEMRIEPDGSISEEDVYRANIRNHAKLAYDSVSQWLDGEAVTIEAIERSPEVAGNLRVQAEAAERLLEFRRSLGALDLETIQASAVIKDDEVVDVVETRKNRARQLIEDFMVAANGVTTRFLERKSSPTFRRVVRVPRRWSRIVDLAKEHEFDLPGDPDPRALDEFLAIQKKKDPLRFPDLSLSVVKLLGSGEYVAEKPGDPPLGHFGLAVHDYSHSTAPNRRFPDVITHRLLKAVLDGGGRPYDADDLERLAQHCTKKEDDAKKVERHVQKSAAAILLRHRVGDHFDGIVTGASDKGTWVRIFHPTVEGRVVHGHKDLDVGHRVRVRLDGVDVERGYIDFKA